MKPSKGVIYIAGGHMKYVREAIFSAKSLKKYNPQLKATLYTNIPGIKSKCFDSVIFDNAPEHPQKRKIYNMLNSPYDHTLYIDSDTEFKGPIYEIFDFLLNYDIAVTNRVKCKWPANANPQFVDYVDEACYNGGFLLFKKSNASKEIIERWYDKMSKIEDHLIKAGTEFGDQVALNSIFFEERLPEKVGLNYVILPNKIYNARPWMWNRLKEDAEFSNVKILHAHNLEGQRLLRLKMKIRAFLSR